MGVGEERPPPRQAVDVRRLHLRMSAQAPNPIVQVIDRNEQDVRPLFRGFAGRVRHGRDRQGDDRKYQGLAHTIKSSLDLSRGIPDGRPVIALSECVTFAISNSKPSHGISVKSTST